MDVTQFRSDFPEFSDTAVYTTSQITFWAGLAEKMVVESVWQDMYETGVKLYVAHELVMAQQNSRTAQVGGIPGQGAGISASKTVGSVSVSSDQSTTTEQNAGWWNMTNYGKQFYRLMRLFGSGCVQL